MSLWWRIIFTVAFSPILAIILKHLLRSNGKQRSNLPSGPVGWPLLGSTLSFNRPHSSNTLGDFMQTQITKYGRIFTMVFAGERALVSTDPELTRFVLQNEMKLFENNHPKHLRTLFGNTGLGFLRGDDYRLKKSVIVSFIHSFGAQTFLSRAKEIVARQMSGWHDKDFVHMAEETSRFSFNIIVELVTGVGPDHPGLEELRKHVIIFHRGSSVIPIDLPWTYYHKAKLAKEKISEFLMQIIKEKQIHKKDCSERTDLIDRLMVDTPYPDEEISNSTMMLIFAGLYTTANTIAVAICFLTKYPKAIEQMREEIQQVIKSKENGELTWEDYKNMEFTQSVINEALRLGNVAPCLFKKALKDIEFKGYEIPKGTPIVAHMASGHLDSSVFENPTEFNPWRWLGEDGMKKFDSWMPFGGGLRYCTGKDVARIEISVFLSNLLLKYDLEPVEPDEPIACPMVKFPKGLPIRIRTRNSSS